MKATFAFEESTSPVSRLAATKTKTYPQAQYMGLCQFTNVFWEFDRDKNYAPRLVFEGDVERMDAIDTKFPHNIDTVYFSRNKPHIRYDYQFNDEQYVALGAKGFWSEDGVHIPEIFMTSKFQLECDAVVKEVSQAYDNQTVPIFNIKLAHPYENTFNIEQYDISEFITREQPDESKALENNKTYQDLAPETDIEKEVEAAKAALIAAQEQDAQAVYVPLSPEELDIRRKSSDVSNYVNTIRDDIQEKRDRDNALVEAEKAKIAAEQAAAENKSAAPVKDKNTVEFEETAAKSDAAEKLAGEEEADKYENNSEIFNGSDSDETTEIPDNIAEFMKRLGATDAEDNTESNSVTKTDKKDDNSGSGAASGADGLGVYTFEDQDTAQFEMRADEGKGNEKPENENEDSDESDNKQNDKPAEKSDENLNHRKSQLTSTIQDTTVSAAPDRDDRSK